MLKHRPRLDSPVAVGAIFNDAAERLGKHKIDSLPLPLAAEGAYFRLLRWVAWADTDVLGTTEEVEKILGVDTEGKIVKALRSVGLIRMVQGECVLAASVDHIGAAHRRRWERAHPESYKVAAKRSKPLHNIAPEDARYQDVPDEWVTPPDEAAPNIELDEEQPDEGGVEYDLFGQPAMKSGPKKTRSGTAAATPGHREFTDHWFGLYAARYNRSPIWRARDGSQLKILLANIDLDDLKAAAAAYIRCREPFFAGHDFGKFCNQINRWLAEGAKGSAAGGADLPHL